MSDATYTCTDYAAWSYAVEMCTMTPTALQTHLQAKAALGWEIVDVKVKSWNAAGNAYHIVYKTPA